jgi:hypothetical protein
MMRLLIRSVLCALAACGDGGAVTPDASIDAAVDAAIDAPPGFLVDGTLVATGGAALPPTGRLAAFWHVTGGSPDYIYKFGDGASTGAAATMRLAADPPDLAINKSAVGVAMLAVYDPTVAIPDGEIDEATLNAGLRGLGTRHAVIFKAAPFAAFPWLDAFPLGYSCARCVAAPVGQTFETWEPAACSEVIVDVAPDPPALDVCNWT